MAVTSIWPIKGRVDKVINYARNPEKTHDKEKLSELHEIEGVVEYAADEMKTEKRAYVTCLHLHSEETAAQEFMETKRLMHNEGGRSCYHGYQSFKADEVDADTAHSIGVALARELWGDRFQVVIATHCNTGHYHNHFVINSVSDVDGKKFYNSPADYRRMREVSDRLCREAKISVIEYPANRRTNYGEWLAEKEKQVEALTQQRTGLKNELKRHIRKEDFQSAEATRARIAELTTELKTCRKEITLCSDIADRSEQVRKSLEQIDRQKIERKERTENELLVRRSSRAGREDDAQRR